MVSVVYTEQVLGYLILAATAAAATYEWLVLPSLRSGWAGRRRGVSRRLAVSPVRDRKPAARRSPAGPSGPHRRQPRVA